MTTWQVITGDCLEVLRGMPSGSVDCCVTDPPYGVNYKYDAHFDDSPENWLANVATLLPEMLRVARGVVIWFGAAPTMDRDRAALSPERMLMWAPSFTNSSSRKDGVFYRWHPIYCWRLSEAHEAEAGEAAKGLHSDVLTDPTEGRSWWTHPATKPTELMGRLVRVAAPGAIVLDPFCGSGTTGVACVQTGRSFIGVEIDEKYAAIARQRIGEAADAQLFTRPVQRIEQPSLIVEPS